MLQCPLGPLLDPFGPLLVQYNNQNTLIEQSLCIKHFNKAVKKIKITLITVFSQCYAMKLGKNVQLVSCNQLHVLYRLTD